MLKRVKNNQPIAEGEDDDNDQNWVWDMGSGNEEGKN